MSSETGSHHTAGGVLALARPITNGALSLEATLARRRSTRAFGADRLTSVELGQLLWAAQGITSGDLRRAAPSPSGLYPLECYAVTADGVFHYLPNEHALCPTLSGDLRADLRRAAHEQPFIEAAPAIVVIAGVVERVAVRYGDRATRYMAIEAGHAAQGLLLEATALGLVGLGCGSFDDDEVARVVGLGAGELPLYLIPIGHPA